jgi:hypothetical protein
MQFAVSHDAIATDQPAHEPSAAKHRRVATTTTLLAVAVCAIMAKGHLTGARMSPHNAAMAENAGTAPVTVVAPEFCKDQTWPYIDSRCLRRVDNPPADDHQAITPVTVATAAPAPDGASANTAATPAATAASPTDPRAQVVQSVIPAAVPSTAPDAGAGTDAPAYQRTSDVSQHRRPQHWNDHFGFFGFRF